MAFFSLSHLVYKRFTLSDGNKSHLMCNKKFQCKIVNAFLPIFLSHVLGAQKNRLIETVLLSTHNICFGSEIRKLFFCYTLLTKVKILLLVYMSFPIGYGLE